jgi:hypothetical protein
MIEPIINGTARYKSKNKAIQVLVDIRATFTCRARRGSELRYDYEYISIEGYALTDQEKEECFWGSNAKIFVIERDGYFIVTHERIDDPDWNLPKKYTSLKKRNAPHWGIKTLRIITKSGRRKFKTIEEAHAELEFLESTFNTVLKLSDSKVTAYVYRRDPESGKVYHDHIEISIGIDLEDTPYLFIARQDKIGKKKKLQLDYKLENIDVKAMDNFAHAAFSPTDDLSLFVSRIFIREIYGFEGRKRFKNIENSSSDTLYHFTSPENCKNILISGELWLYDISTMNDKTEVVHGNSTILSFLEDIISDLSELDTEDGRWRRSILSEVEEDFARTPLSIPIFSTCLTDRENNSLQWTAYGRGGDGVAIGFNRKALQNAISNFGIQLRRVYYYKDSKRMMLNNIISSIFANEVTRSFNSQDLIRSISENLRRIAPIFKHECFYGENEWRIIAIQDKENKGWIEKASPKGKKGLDAGYIIFDVCDNKQRCISNIIEEIVVGYGSDSADVANYWRGEIRRMGLEKDIPVRISDIPLGSF